MGYDRHITRGLNWAEHDGEPITLREWLDVVQSDPELWLDLPNGQYFAVWHPSGKVGESSQVKRRGHRP
jgi:hypothetical protein